MPENILEKIIKNKIKKIDILKKSISLDSLKDRINENKSFMNFKEKIENNIKNDKISIIAEIKKASPSSGLILKIIILLILLKFTIVTMQHVYQF